MVYNMVTDSGASKIAFYYSSKENFYLLKCYLKNSQSENLALNTYFENYSEEKVFLKNCLKSTNNKMKTGIRL